VRDLMQTDGQVLLRATMLGRQRQPGWGAAGQRIRRTGEVFLMTTIGGSIRENHVVEFEEGRRVAWIPPAEPGRVPRGTSGGGDSTRSTRHAPGVTHTYV